MQQLAENLSPKKKPSFYMRAFFYCFGRTAPKTPYTSATGRKAVTKHRMTTKIRMSEALIPNFSDSPPQTPSNTFLLLDRYNEFKFFSPFVYSYN